MNALGTGVFTPRSEGQRIRASSGNQVTGALSDALQRRTLSYDRVSELVAQLIGRRFSGTMAVHFEAGYIICADLEPPIKE